MKGTARPSKHPSPPGVSGDGARGDEDTHDENDIAPSPDGIKTSKHEAMVPYETPKNRTTPARADEDDIR